jgi:hypothetical protein
MRHRRRRLSAQSRQDHSPLERLPDVLEVRQRYAEYHVEEFDLPEPGGDSTT